MARRSADVAAERPFYDLHATAYDALIDDPVEPWVDAVDEALEAAGLGSARLLDAGCGTGRHAAALVERGHEVTLLDASSALLQIARKRCPDVPALLTDLCAPATSATFDAVVSRGVLNDLLTDQERADALSSFARLTRSGGVLVLDLRDARGSEERADGLWRTREVDLPDGSHLRFDSRPTWANGRIVVDERYEFTSGPDASPVAREYTFEMRPWTTEELDDRRCRRGTTASLSPAASEGRPRIVSWCAPGDEIGSAASRVLAGKRSARFATTGGQAATATGRRRARSRDR